MSGLVVDITHTTKFSTSALPGPQPTPATFSPRLPSLAPDAPATELPVTAEHPETSLPPELIRTLRQARWVGTHARSRQHTLGARQRSVGAGDSQGVRCGRNANRAADQDSMRARNTRLPSQRACQVSTARVAAGRAHELRTHRGSRGSDRACGSTPHLRDDADADARTQ